MYTNRIGSQGHYPSLNTQTSTSLQNNPFAAPSAPELPLHLLDLDTPVKAPYYPVINKDGTLSYHSSSTPTWTAHWPEPFPVAPTIEAAQHYADAMQGHFKPLDSVQQFIESDNFSDAQKAGIQAYYTKNHMSIGIAHQLEELVGHRFEFILDDHKDTTPHEFESLKREICKRVELLRHIPNAGITIRSFSEYNNPKTYHVEHESLSEQVFFNIRDDLLQRQLSKNTGSFQQVYETAVGDAVYSGIKTIPYVFSARDLTQGKSRDSSQVKMLAKNLTKAVVNRPEMMAPTAFFPCSTNTESNKIIDKLDTIAKKVGVIRPFNQERKEIITQQSKRFPYSEGFHIQASLLCPVNSFWDEIDEGRIFSKVELENHLGIPVKPELYDAYFDEVLDIQAAIFMEDEAQAEQESRSSSTGWNSLKLPNMPFETSTKSKYLERVPALREQIETLRMNPAWTDEVENGINSMCADNGIPIGIGLHMFQVVEKRHELNIDNSYSMGYRADQTDETPRPLIDHRGEFHQSRMEELKSLLNVAGSLLSYLPTKGVTLSTMYDNNRVENHPHWSLPASGLHNREVFLRELDHILSPIQPSGGTPLNRTAQYVYERANRCAEKTNVIFFTDGQPSDGGTSSFGGTSHRAPPGSIVNNGSIREFIKRLVNRDAEHIPVTIAQTTNNPKAVAWSNLADKVCKKTNAIDDKESEIAQVQAHHGKSFYYNEKIYAIALLLGNDNPLFDGLDENGIFSKVALETLYGRPLEDTDYDLYFDQAYALQCEPKTETLKSTSVSAYANWVSKSSSFRPAASSKHGVSRNRLTKLTQMQANLSIMEKPLLEQPSEEFKEAPSAEGSSSAQVLSPATAPKKASRSILQRFFFKR